MRLRRQLATTYKAQGKLFFALDRRPAVGGLRRSGQGVVLFPDDAHASCLRVDDRK